MIISWQGIYANSEYFGAGLYSYNGPAFYTVPAVLPTAADGVYFSVDLGGGLIYLKRVG